MADRLTVVADSNLLDNKVQVLLKEFNDKILQLQLSEKEEVGLIYNQVFEKFFKTLDSPIFQEEFIFPKDEMEYEELNKIFFNLAQDLEILFKELNFLQKAVVKNFNSLIVSSEKVRSEIAKIFYELGVLTIYGQNKSKDVLFFEDSFKNMEFIEINSIFYSNNKCQYNPDAELMTLPINKSELYNISNITIGTLSNGVLGNNQQIGALLRSNLNMLADNNPDTWVEYEYVNVAPIEKPLIFQLKFQLEKDSIINSLSISVLPFSGGSYPYITQIDLSLDGVLFESILDDIVGPVVYLENKKAIFLEPTSSGSGETRKILFYPKKARFINITFWQNDSYLIVSPAGVINRIAIGIKEIGFTGEVYEEKGEVISTQYLAQDEVKFVSVATDVVQLDGLYDLYNFISVDNGQSWIEIRDIDSFGKDNPETLVFNLLDPRSIETNLPVFSLRYKGFMQRNSNSFNSTSGVVRITKHKIEFVSILPGSNTFSILEKPLADTFILYNVLFGSAGNDKFYSFNSVRLIKTSDGYYEARLPWEAFPRNSIAVDSEVIYINHEKWSRVNRIDNTAAPTDRIYEMDYRNSIIRFGNGTNGVLVDGLIQFGLKKEPANVIMEDPLYVKTNFKTDGVIENISLYRLIPNNKKLAYILKKLSRIFPLDVTDVQSIAVVNDPVFVLKKEVPYVNGYIELRINGDYSIDYINGVIYSFTESPANSDLKIDITHGIREEITDFTVKGDQIIFGDSSDFISEEFSFSFFASTNAFNLPKDRVVKNSLIFTEGGENFLREIPYKGDGTEFKNLTFTELIGAYTVDYYKGVVYTYNKLNANVAIDFKYSNYFIHYNIGIEVPSEDIIIDNTRQTVTLSQNYVLKMMDRVFTGEVVRDLFKCEYDYAQEIDPSFKELESYVTPYLNMYRVGYIDVAHL